MSATSTEISAGTAMTAATRAAEFGQFLDAIDASVPDGLEVHVVLDNASTHKTPAIHKWLLRHPRFTDLPGRVALVTGGFRRGRCGGGPDTDTCRAGTGLDTATACETNVGVP